MKGPIFKIMAEFAKEIKKQSDAKACVQINMSENQIFKMLDPQVFYQADGIGWTQNIPEDKVFDLIVGNLPIGLPRKTVYKEGTKKLKLRQNWVEILKALEFLKHDGIAFFLMEPIAFGSKDGIKFESLLNEKGYHYNAIINTPVGTIFPASITPVLAFISKINSPSVFVAEIFNETQARELVNNYFNKAAGSDLICGMEIPQKTFKGFKHLKVQRQIEKLETQFNEYTEYTISELATEINIVRSGDNFPQKENSIYFPKNGTSKVVSNLSQLSIKSHNCFQVVFGKKVNNKYIAAYFQSALGKLVRESLKKGMVIGSINKRDLGQALIAVPPLNKQEKIVFTHDKLKDLKIGINKIEEELALNPNNADSLSGQLNGMLEAINGLSDIDRVRDYIRQGESKKIEYKQTLSLDVKKNSKEKYVEHSALKTLVAFLNTEGGTLLVGIHDSGSIVGIDDEINKFHQECRDKFLLHFKNLIKRSIGEDKYPFIEYKLIRIDGKTILMVVCKESPSPCYLDKKDFFVRTNPATDKLEGPQLVEYVSNHFNR